MKKARGNPTATHFRKSPAAVVNYTIWERTCSVLANMKHLCDLRMAIKAPSRYTPIQGEAILAPLMAVKQVRTFLTDVSWPLDHEKGRGDVPYRLRQLPSPWSPEANRSSLNAIGCYSSVGKANIYWLREGRFGVAAICCFRQLQTVVCSGDFASRGGAAMFFSVCS